MLTRSGEDSRKRRLPPSFCFPEIPAQCTTSSAAVKDSSKKQRLGCINALSRPSSPDLPSPSSNADQNSQIASADDRNGINTAIALTPPTSDPPLLENRTGDERDPVKIRGKLAKFPPFEVRWREREFTADFHPLIHELRSLIRNRLRGCGLCAWYEWGPIVGTHKLKYCTHREEADEARRWLEMFRGYRAEGGGTGARCQYCLFPVAVCWRTVYKEEMDGKYGNEVEAREQYDEWYLEARCNWAKAIQRFVASRMVAGGVISGRGVSQIAVTALEEMGWKDWKDLEEIGPIHIQKWLEEADEIEGLRCPRLLTLFWKLAKESMKDR